MYNRTEEWNPTSPVAWAQTLGLIHVPMFGPQTSYILKGLNGCHSVLLDGNAASFAITITDDSELSYDNKPLSWCWSSNLRHMIIIEQNSEKMFLRRWDTPPEEARIFKIPKNPQAVIELFRLIDKARPLYFEDVVIYVLRAFRQIRNSLHSSDVLNSLHLLNLFLLGTEAVRSLRISISDWHNFKTVDDVIKILEPVEREMLGTDNFTREIRSIDFTWLCKYFLRSPITQIDFEPGLLLRHAAGQLYQEAHINIESEFRQLHFKGLAPETAPRGFTKKDVRFTPPVLARTLVEQAFNASDINLDTKESIDILDPACGSGIFLQETLRELVERGYKGHITLRGFDISKISHSIANFCLTRAKQDALSSNLSVDIDIKVCDSLQVDWGTPDILLMNPPFIPWDRISNKEQSMVRDVLGPLAKGRMDMAMAFIWKAAKSLMPNSILASVMPAPLFETQSGQLWREALSSEAQLLLLGRFEGYGFFRNTMVEPGFLLLRGTKDKTHFPPKNVKIILAKNGYEERSLRSLRKNIALQGEPEQYEIFSIPADTVFSSTWMPRSKKYMQLFETLSERKITTVSDLFYVRQGIRTGDNKTFIISADEFKSLPVKERSFFRPIASNSTIKDSKLYSTEFVFYPYSNYLPKLFVEEDLYKYLPNYYEKWLKPNKNKLISRARVKIENWWRLSEHRNWQVEKYPKIVSTYFGYRGSFAYDEKGDSVVVQGFAWLWKKDKEIGHSDMMFHQTILPWAYLAILNSRFFENLLKSLCPPIQGGQLNLSSRFVNKIFIPDLSDDLRITSDIIHKLQSYGKNIYNLEVHELQKLDDLVQRAYGVSIS